MVHSQKHRMIFMRIPKHDDLVAILNVNLGFQIKQAPMSKSNIRSTNSLESKRTIEFLDSSVHDSVAKRVLEQGIYLFQLQHGPKCLDATLMQSFFAKYLDSVKWEHINLGLHPLDGLKYCKVEVGMYYGLISIRNSVSLILPVKHMVWMNAGQTIWTDLEPKDSMTFVDYMYFFSPLEKLLRNVATSAQMHAIERHGLITIPETLSLTAENVEPFKVWIGDEHFVVIVYQAHETLVAMLILDTPETFEHFSQGALFKRLDNTLKHPLMVLSTHIKQTGNASASSDKTYKFVHINNLDLALIGSPEDSFTSSILASPELIDSLNDIKESLYSRTVTQMCVKTVSDFWVVGEQYGNRQLFLFVAKRDATLPEISEELRRLKISLLM